MKMFLFPFIAFFAVLISNNSCQEKATEAIVNDLPYPSVAEQRAQLATKKWVTPTRLLDSAQIINDLEYLAADASEGRKPGTQGHARSMERILSRLRVAGLDSFDQSLVQVFETPGTVAGKNIVGWVKGTTNPDKFIVVSAHYDHLGTKPNGDVFNGADDNASGVACLLALASYFKKNPHAYSIIFAAFDKEESGLAGASYFVQQRETKKNLDAIRFNLNLDMIARSDKNEIFACGIRHSPQYKNVIDSVQRKTNVKLLMGHDSGPAADDWTTQSDHFRFHARQIPFLYIGVEDHPDYHATSDTYDKINYHRYIENCNMIALLLQALKPN